MKDLSRGDLDRVIELTKLVVESKPAWQKAFPEDRAAEIWQVFCYFAEKACDNFGTPFKPVSEED